MIYPVIQINLSIMIGCEPFFEMAVIAKGCAANLKYRKQQAAASAS